MDSSVSGQPSPEKENEENEWNDTDEEPGPTKVFKLLKAQFNKLGSDIGLGAQSKDTDLFVKKLE